MNELEELVRLLAANRARGGYQAPEPYQQMTNPSGQFPTMRQQDLQRRPEGLQWPGPNGQDFVDAFNRQQPREYVGVPEHEDDVFGY